MAGFGAPLVWQVNKAVAPSVTVWSDGGVAKVGAKPKTHCETMRGKKTAAERRQKEERRKINVEEKTGE